MKDNINNKPSIIRENKNNTIIKIQINNTLQFIQSNIILNDAKAHGIIRIDENLYSLIDPNKKYFVHYNLSSTNHKKDKLYLLPKILKHGQYNNGIETLPLLDFNNIFICKCISIKENVKYTDITSNELKYSMNNIKSKDDIKEFIISNYSKSLPYLKKEELDKMPISVTKLEIIGKYSFNEKLIFNSMRSGFGKGLLEVAEKNKNIVALTADLKESLKLVEFEKKYKNRFYEFGISEQNMLSAASGMTINNKIPFCCSYAAFNPGRNWDQLRVSVCYSNANVKIVGSHAGLTTGPDGATHQALEDIAITRCLPNLTVICPCDYEESKKAVHASANHKGPVFIRLSREKSLNMTNKNTKFNIGKANILCEGNDLTIISFGIGLSIALNAVYLLKEKGIYATLINMHTIKPLDEKTILKYANLTKKIITLEEHQVIGGLGSAVAEIVSQKTNAKLKILGVENIFGQSGNGYELLDKYNLTSSNIIKTAIDLIKNTD